MELIMNISSLYGNNNASDEDYYYGNETGEDYDQEEPATTPIPYNKTNNSAYSNSPLETTILVILYAIIHILCLVGKFKNGVKYKELNIRNEGLS
jgi:hypothetical protein